MAARCAAEAFNTTCAVHVEDCEGRWTEGQLGLSEFSVLSWVSAVEGCLLRGFHCIPS